MCFIFFLSELLFLISAAFWRELWKIFFKGYIAVVFGWKLIFLFDRFLSEFSEKVKVYCGICEFSTLWLLNEAYSTIFHGLEGLWAEILRQNFVLVAESEKPTWKEEKSPKILFFWCIEVIDWQFLVFCNLFHGYWIYEVKKMESRVWKSYFWGNKTTPSPL